MDATGDELALGVAHILAMAVEHQRHAVRRAADWPDPEDDMADLLAPVPDEEQVAGAQRLIRSSYDDGSSTRWSRVVRPSPGPLAARSSDWRSTSVFSRMPKPRL